VPSLSLHTLTSALRCFVGVSSSRGGSESPNYIIRVSLLPFPGEFAFALRSSSFYFESMAAMPVLAMRRSEREIYCRDWSSAPQLLQQWQATCGLAFLALTVCALCGCAALAGLDLKLETVPPQGDLPPYALANALMEVRTRDPSGRWYACSSCKKKPSAWTRYLVMHSPANCRSLLSMHPLKLQLLSLVDVSIEMVKKIRGFAHGILEESSILDGPLIC
jgi:hypothetical protein